MTEENSNRELATSAIARRDAFGTEGAMAGLLLALGLGVSSAGASPEVSPRAMINKIPPPDQKRLKRYYARLSQGGEGPDGAVIALVGLGKILNSSRDEIARGVPPKAWLGDPDLGPLFTPPNGGMGPQECIALICGLILLAIQIYEDTH